jgi:RNA polymerase sigma-70 factor (ECF subfamily)
MVASSLPSTLDQPSRALTDRAKRESASRQEALHDAILVRRFNGGDETAFIEIVSRYREKMFAVALGLLRNRADAEEIAQDAFIRAHRGLARFRGDASLATWLHRIALNLARNRYWYYFRRCRHATLPLDAAFGDGNTATFAELLASDEPSPVREAANSEFATIINCCTDMLTADQREILKMRNVQHHSYGHISRKLGIGIGTVKSRIARARSRLRVVLAKTYPEFTPESTSIESLEPFRSAGRLKVVGG